MKRLGFCVGCAWTAALASSPLAAKTTMETDVGVDTVATRNEAKLLDCDSYTYDRRGVLALRPAVTDRAQALTGSFTGRGLLTDGNHVRPYEAEGKLSGELHQGLSTAQFGAASSYSNSDLWGCSTSVVERLQRQRDIQNKIVVPGESTHISGANAGYIYGRGSNLVSVLLSTSHLVASLTDLRSDLNVRIDRGLERKLKGALIFGIGDRNGTFEKFNEVHGGGTLTAEPNTRSQVLLSTDTEFRSSGERRLVNSAVLAHKYDRVWAEKVTFASRKAVHSSVNSEVEGAVGVVSTLGDLSLDLSLHRLEVDDPLRSAGNWLSGLATHALTRRQALILSGSYGSEQPVLMHFISSAGIAYQASLGRPPGRPGVGDPRWALNCSYLETFLVDRSDHKNAVRQIKLGVVATF